MSSTFLHFLYHNDPVIAIKKTREYLHDQFHNPTRTRQQFSDEMKEIMGRLFGARSWLYESRYNSELYLHLKMLLKPDSFLTLLHEWNQRCGLFEFSRSQLPYGVRSDSMDSFVRIPLFDYFLYRFAFYAVNGPDETFFTLADKLSMNNSMIGMSNMGFNHTNRDIRGSASHYFHDFFVEEEELDNFASKSALSSSAPSLANRRLQPSSVASPYAMQNKSMTVSPLVGSRSGVVGGHTTPMMTSSSRLSSPTNLSSANATPLKSSSTMYSAASASTPVVTRRSMDDENLINGGVGGSASKAVLDGLLNLISPLSSKSSSKSSTSTSRRCIVQEILDQYLHFFLPLPEDMGSTMDRSRTDIRNLYANLFVHIMGSFWMNQQVMIQEKPARYEFDPMFCKNAQSVIYLALQLVKHIIKFEDIRGYIDKEYVPQSSLLRELLPDLYSLIEASFVSWPFGERMPFTAILCLWITYTQPWTVYKNKYSPKWDLYIEANQEMYWNLFNRFLFFISKINLSDSPREHLKLIGRVVSLFVTSTCLITKRREPTKLTLFIKPNKNAEELDEICNNLKQIISLSVVLPQMEQRHGFEPPKYDRLLRPPDTTENELFVKPLVYLTLYLRSVTGWHSLDLRVLADYYNMAFILVSSFVLYLFLRVVSMILH